MSMRLAKQATRKKRRTKQKKRAEAVVPAEVTEFYALAGEWSAARTGQRGLKAWVQSGSPLAIAIILVAVWLGFGASAAVLGKGSKVLPRKTQRSLMALGKVGFLLGGGLAVLVLTPLGYAVVRLTASPESSAEGATSIAGATAAGVVRAACRTQATLGVAGGVSAVLVSGLALTFVPENYPALRFGISGAVVLAGLASIGWGASRFAAAQGPVLDTLERDPSELASVETSSRVGAGAKPQQVLSLQRTDGEAASYVVPARFGAGLDRYLAQIA